ncbi:MAG: glycosyltransferase family 1 protein, partial [Deltaproteobacteria bacterium]
MRVGFLTHGIFPYHLGGMQRHSTNLANALSGLGLEVEVIHPGAPAGGEEAPAGTFAFSEVIVPWPDDLQYIPASWFFARRIAEVIEDRDYDVLYGQGFTLWAYLGRRKRLPTIFNPHGLEMYASVGVEDTLKALPFRFMVRYHARRADRTISLGGKLTEILRERVGVPPERIAVIPNGVDPDYFERAADTAKEPNALFFIGRFAFNKGILPLIEAFNELRDTPVRLYVAGGGKLEARARALCRNDNVTFLGRISDEALKSWYRRCEAYILPSLYEGMPTVILEAMANGLPIIATD